MGWNSALFPDPLSELEEPPGCRRARSRSRPSPDPFYDRLLLSRISCIFLLRALVGILFTVVILVSAPLSLVRK